MPLEIIEIQVTASVTETGKKARRRDADAATNKDEIISECVERVLEILKEKQEH